MRKDLLKTETNLNRWRPLALVITALLGLAVRLYGLDWDSMQNFHPDERQVMFQVTKMAWPHSWAQFFDITNSPLNPHFFAYGTFPIYLLAIVGNLLSHIAPDLTDLAHLTLVGRVINTLFDTGTIVLTGWLGLLLTPDPTPERRRAWSVALLAAACMAFIPLGVQLAHFYTVDTPALFFITLALLACVKLVHTEKLVRWSLVAGLAYGLALATKFSAAPLAVPLLVALLLRWYHRRDFWECFIPLVYTACATFLSFVVAMPYALLDFKEFSQQVSDEGALARGMRDLPYIRQFAGTTPYLYEIQNMVLWGMGLILGMVVLVGLVWLCWRLWRHHMAIWLILLSWVVVYGGINGSFFTKYMRYMLPLYPSLILMGMCMLIWLWSLDLVNWRPLWARVVKVGSYALIALVLAGTLFQCLALDNIYSQPNTRIQASNWIYANLKPGTVLTYEQWDDALPVTVDGHQPYIYPQAMYSYTGDAGQAFTGLDLYGDDSTAKAQMIAAMLMQAGAITMPTDRLDKSIPRLPDRYPLTIHYYQLLNSGQLGFHLAKVFANHPSFLGITLDDSGADESYSVFDHPTAKIYVRDTPFPFQNAAQLAAKLLDGVQLPPRNPQQLVSNKSLLLTPQQIADDQSSPPFGQQFPAQSLANQFPALFWWLTLLLLGWLLYPLAFLILRGLADRGYLFAKTLGVLLLGYLCWLLASWHLVPFSQLATFEIIGLLASAALILVLWLRRSLWAFVRQHWQIFLIEECLFTLAFLLFVLIRSYNPDLWNPGLGGEKPMELAFLNGILRSPYMPPLDPWFAGGSINYYYFGYVLVAALIKFTGIVPTTAFNLAIPTLFALTFTGAVAIIYSFTQRWWAGLLGGYLVALLGNLDGAVQIVQTVGNILHHQPLADFSYWQSSRVIPFTIHEFPFWSFLFADLHAHVLAMPFSLSMLGLIASFFLERKIIQGEKTASALSRLPFYLLTSLIFGAIACINPWDMPVYALLLGVALLLDTFYQQRERSALQRWTGLAQTVIIFLLIFAGSYLFFWPFYAWYQQLYVNGVGVVKQSTTLGDYLHVSGFWFFLLVSFFLVELYRWASYRAGNGPSSPLLVRFWQGPAWQRIVLYLLVSALVLTLLALAGIKVLLGALLVLGLLLFLLNGILSARSRDESFWNARTRYMYLLLLVGLGISLGIEVVYIRDFLDGGDYERMNTFFKFSMQMWLCLGLGGTLAIWQLWHSLRGPLKSIWSLLLILLLVGSSIFLIDGTFARIQDHQSWSSYTAPLASPNYTPTLDGFAFAHAWYPGDAQAITWLNQHIAGSPVILEAASPYDYTWFNRVSVYTGLPDLVGWVGHENEQRTGDQPTSRMADISVIYTTTDTALALEFLHHYNVGYIYIGDLERQAYANQAGNGLEKFNLMAQQGTLKLVYQAGGVSIYQVR